MFLQPHQTVKTPTRTTRTRILQQQYNNNEEEPQELILGEQMSQALSSIGTTEQSVLDAARRRSEEAKARYQAAYEQELVEAEAKRRERQERDRLIEEGRVEELRDDANSGPGDMSSFQGFVNDGFEASDENGDGWVTDGPVVAGGGDDQIDQNNGEQGGEEPQLYLFNEGEGGDNGGLIL